MNPSTYTQALADEIVRRLSEGEPLAWICRDEYMPASRTVSDWRATRPAFDADFLAARDAGFDAIAARLRSTARGKRSDDGGDSTGDVQRDKLIIDTDLKLLSKWDPRRYGDKVHMEHSGAIDRMSDDELNARLRQFMASDAEGESA